MAENEAHAIAITRNIISSLPPPRSALVARRGSGAGGADADDVMGPGEGWQEPMYPPEQLRGE